MEGLLTRWIAFATIIDLTGTRHPGVFWGLGPTNTTDTQSVAAPAARTACLAVQPLDVFEVQLPDDIDNVDNESRDELLKKAGYRGNNNRRAIPIIVVRYATALPSLGSQKVRDALDVQDVV
jgi:hypothetical protein